MYISLFHQFRCLILSTDSCRFQRFSHLSSSCSFFKKCEEEFLNAVVVVVVVAVFFIDAFRSLAKSHRIIGIRSAKVFAPFIS